MPIVEIQFPDLVVTRYPQSRVVELLASKKLEQHWPARLKGSEEWFTVHYLMEQGNTQVAGPQALPVEYPPSHTGAHKKEAPPRQFTGGDQDPPTTHVKQVHGLRTSLGNQETVIASIGQRSLVGFLKGEGLAMTNIILTDKRIYGRGKIIDRSASSEGWLVGDVSAISAVSLMKASHWKTLAFGVTLFFIALFVISDTSRIVAGSLYMVGMASVVFYFITRKKVLHLNLTGYAYNFSMGGVDDETIRSFMEQTILFLADRKKI